MKRRKIGYLIITLGVIGTILGFSKVQNDTSSGMFTLSISIIIIVIGMFFFFPRKEN